MDELTRKLYGIEPDRFMTARAEAAAAARSPAEAKEIIKLRKPTMGAWLVNLLAIEKPALIGDLVSLSASLREAQRELRGAELRELAQRRRALISALLTTATELAQRAKPGAKLPLFEVEATLNAALSDVDTARLVQSGRLTKTVTYAGMGELTVAESPSRDRSGQKADMPNAGIPNADSADASEAEAERERDEARARARAEAEAAQRELENAEHAEAQATGDLHAIDAELAQLRDRRADAAEELNRRRHALRFAQRAVSAANRRSYELD